MIMAPQLSSGWQLTTQLKQGRQAQWAVYVFSYVYDPTSETLWLSAVAFPINMFWS
jgi:hypothetical protein